jgi:hypothetical protein
MSKKRPLTIPSVTLEVDAYWIFALQFAASGSISVDLANSAGATVEGLLLSKQRQDWNACLQYRPPLQDPDHDLQYPTST